MGDHTGDASMVDGIVDAHAVLKIGFLYDHVSVTYFIKYFLSINFILFFMSFYITQNYKGL